MENKEMTKRKFMQILTISLSASMTCFLGLLFFIEVPTTNKSIVDMTIGALLGFVSATISFYFGDNEKEIKVEVKDNNQQ